MAIRSIGPLRRADEGSNQQIVDTFATVRESDLAWTEKIWTSIARVDGTLQLDFGIGTHQNRGILDRFGGMRPRAVDGPRQPPARRGARGRRRGPGLR